MISTDHLYRRHQVFVSSTFLDLELERNDLRHALNKSNFIVEGMELFPAANKRQWDVIKDRIDRSDIYVLIIAERYGSKADQASSWEPSLVSRDESVSFTQLEFRYARERKIPLLVFIKKASKKLDPRVSGFIQEVQRSNITTDYWASTGELISDVLAGLKHNIEDDEASSNTGWIRASTLQIPVEPGHPSIKLLSKTHYAKFVSYSSKSSGSKPLYRKFIHRLNKEFDVWDEYNTITVSRFSHCLSRMKFYTRTDGDAVDFSIFHPYVSKLTFSDVKAGLHEKEFHPVINAPSNIYATGASYLNGFQDGNIDLAMKATDYMAGSLRLTADFTSIPDHAKLFHLKRTVLIDPDEKLTDVSSLTQTIQPGVFSVECFDVPKDHVLRLDFDIRL